jgi:lysophospholipase
MATAELFGIEGYAPPPGALTRIVRAADGVRLRAASWEPESGASGADGPIPRGTVLVIGGRAEFIERYGETISDLRARDFAVAAFDWRGQGGSDRQVRDRRKGHVERFEDYLADLDAILAELMARLPRPWFVLAHSMGAALCLEAARRGRLPVERLVALAPMIELALVRRPRAARALARLLDGLGLGRAYVPGGGEQPIATRPFAGNRLTGDAGRYARNAALSAAMPHLAVGDPSVRWVREAFRFMDRLQHPETAPGIRLPTLVLAAGADAIVSTPAVEAFAARLRTGMPLVLPGARHEILMERDDIRAAFWAAFDAFVPGEAVQAETPDPPGSAPLAGQTRERLGMEGPVA